jgi:hypothetical protein
MVGLFTVIPPRAMLLTVCRYMERQLPVSSKQCMPRSKVANPRRPEHARHDDHP